MLSIGKMSAGQEEYYLNLAKEDYYLEGGEPEGRWLGGGAKKLGLSGVVEKGALSKLFAGFSPGGEPLVKNAGQKNRQAGWDLTFSVPKSVSVLWAVSSPEVRRELQQATEVAAERSIEHLEQEAGLSRVGQGGRERIASELVVAAFPHGTSRALDPQYHVHCLVLNVGVSKDGKTRTIESKPLYGEKMVAGVFFRTELAAELEKRLGLEVERPLDRHQQPRSWFEVKGVPEKICELFSKRRQAIEKQLGSKGLESAAAASFATLDTREAKAVVPPRETLLENWQRDCKSNGCTPEAVQNLLGRASSRDRVVMYREALQEAVERITYGESHFSEKELLRHTLEASQGRGLESGIVRDWVRRDLVESKQFVNLGVRQAEQRYTTKEVLAVEKELLSSVDEMHKREFKPVSSQVVESVIERERPVGGEAKTLAGKVAERFQSKQETFKLSPEQAEAVRHITQGEGCVKVVTGLAGTGKTEMLKAAREALEKGGYRVLGTALAGVAAKGLQEKAGIESDTVKMRLVTLYKSAGEVAKHHAKQLVRAAVGLPTFKPETLRFGKKTVLVVDEASMVGSRDFCLLAKAVREQGGALVCVGDNWQLPAIERGGAFGSIASRVKGVHLENITRQENVADRSAVSQLSRGDAEGALKHYATEGKLFVAENRQRAQEKLVRDWVAEGGVEKPSEHKIFCGTNQEVERYNEMAQWERADAGELDLSSRVEKDEQIFFAGDRVRFTESSRKLGVVNGQSGTVVACQSGPLGKAVAVKVEREKAPVLDRLTASMKHHGSQLLREAFGKPTKRPKTQSDIVVVPLERLKGLLGKGYDGLRLDYCSTTHAAQGATVAHSYVHLGGGMTDRELSYVQGSRHKRELRLYTDENEAGIALTNLAREHAGGGERLEAKSGHEAEFSPLVKQMQKSQAKELASEIAERNRQRAELEQQR